MNVTEFDAIAKGARALPYKERYEMLAKLAKSVNRDERGKPIDFSLSMPTPAEAEDNEKSLSETISKAVSDELAARHQHDPVGVAVGLLQVVGREHHRLAPAGEGPHRQPKPVSGLDVHGDRAVLDQFSEGVRIRWS